MKALRILLATPVLTLLVSGTAPAYFHANSYGGSTSANASGVSHDNVNGGGSSANSSSVYHTNPYGGGSSDTYANGASHTNAYGYTTTPYDHAVGAPYYPPAAPYYGAGGCYDCGYGLAGAAVAGAAVGTAAISTAALAATPTAGNSGAITYSAGNAAFTMGQMYAQMPANCAGSLAATGTYYYNCGGGLWFTPAYSANNVYYRVVPAP